MKTIHCAVTRVFTNKGKNGNLLGVVTDTGTLTDQKMQAIARRLGYSETSFVFFDTRKGDYRVRFFTPEKEIPFAGHPALGTLFVLLKQGLLPKKNAYVQVIGPRKVPLQLLPDGRIRMDQGKPSFAPGPSRPLAAAMIGAVEGDIGGDPMVISTGLPHLIIPLKKPKALRAARVLNSVYQRVAKDHRAVCVMPFAIEEGQVFCRMFAPALGIAEDPATGSGCGPLACYIAREARIDPTQTEMQVAVLQGYRAKSLLHAWVALRRGRTESVMVGGDCVIARPRTVRL